MWSRFCADAYRTSFSKLSYYGSSKVIIEVALKSVCMIPPIGQIVEQSEDSLQQRFSGHYIVESVGIIGSLDVTSPSWQQYIAELYNAMVWHRRGGTTQE